MLFYANPEVGNNTTYNETIGIENARASIIQTQTHIDYKV